MMFFLSKQEVTRLIERNFVEDYVDQLEDNNLNLDDIEIHLNYSSNPNMYCAIYRTKDVEEDEPVKAGRKDESNG